MPRPSINQLTQRQTARVESLPAPVGGWNARDALANMAPTDAVTLTNLFPGVSSCDLRGGCFAYATGMSGAVETIMVYNAGANSKMFAFDALGLSLHDVTAKGAVGAALVSGVLNARWEYTNVSTPGGNFLYAVNGFDNPLLYDGTTWTHITATSTPAITGVTTSNLSNVLLFKNRVWFIEKNSLRAWYLPTQSIGGLAQLFDLSAVAMQGGYLVDMIPWTVDAGYGANDNLVFITSKGEMIVYQGTDPASITTWAEMGVWQLGAPVGKRCGIKFAGDGLVLSLDGVMPLAASLQSSRLDPRVALTDKIRGATAEAIAEFRFNFGWEMLFYPKRNAIWLNVPMGPGQQQQFVMNSITGAWCNFQNWFANCWALFNDEPYFGGDGTVYQAWDETGYSDNGSNINGNVVQAFNYFDMRGVVKYFTRARPNFLSDGQPNIKVGIAINFDVNENPTPVAYTPTALGLWDIGVWDVDLWAQSLALTANWQGIVGVGYCGGVTFQSASAGLSISWASTDIVYQAGWGGI